MKGYLIIILLLFSGCVYQIDYNPLDYTPIEHDIIYVKPRTEYVYIPRYRPRPLYFYAGWWYDEPYTYITYRDIRGRVAPRKIPKSLMQDIEKKMKEHKPPRMRMPQRIPNKDRVRNRKRTRRNGRI